MSEKISYEQKKRENSDKDEHQEEMRKGLIQYKFLHEKI